MVRDSGGIGIKCGEQLVHSSLQMRSSRANGNGPKFLNIGRYWRVRTGQEKLANRRFKNPTVRVKVWIEHSVISPKIDCHATVTVVVEKR